MQQNIKTLISTADIQARVAQLADEISAYYGNDEILVISVLNGAMIFTADLVRRLKCPLRLDSLAVSSYSGQCSTGQITFRSRPKLAVKGTRVLLIDDILDTGTTALKLIAYLKNEGAEEVRFCVLLDKQLKAERQLKKADFTGFVIPERYVVGYGLDADEKFRNLPFIGII